MTKYQITIGTELIKSQSDMLLRICAARTAEQVSDAVQKEADRLTAESKELQEEAEKINQ